MKKKLFILAAVAAAGVLVLSGCTSSESETAQSVSGTQTGGNTGAGSISDNQGSTGNDDAASAQDVSGVQIAGSGTDGTATSGGSVSGDDAAPAQAGTPVEDGGPVGEVIPDEYADGDTGETEETEETEAESSAGITGDIWSGTYAGEEETLTISYLDEKSISFAFSQAGISGTAQVDGYQAVYKGDDHYVVVFNVNNDINTVEVTVSNEEDYDASGSPLIGTYVKEVS